MTKFAFVTGANKGIGYETVRQLAEKDFHVFLGARNAEFGQKAIQSLGMSNVSFVQVDISNTQSIQDSVKNILEFTDHLDLLINNAGIALDFNILPSELTVGTLRQEFDVNFFGTFQMIQAFLPLVKKAPNGKIINLTTDMASQTMFDNGDVHPLNILGYNSSKTAVNALTLGFGKEFGTNGPEILGVTPGFTTTDLNGNAPGGKTPAEGAQIIVKYALSETNYNGKILNQNGIIPW
ncbi:NAD(P)-dependent dehydrogenase (short-subunit alcohol dehydrogenase family) [Bacillus sp. SORGH_AS 510]|uniref:SDR family NAD(P)-dependent oxidoreductase n=1 Tax=Bacillus sp. SORGH_AS_0510 TaxID=3041771 RepID=UPI002780B18C|nr:SDR family NAD(P)-dependent oxidoreductase [Bacillus sp. SORGH_AS_0510]MDQ1146174.1 NAD(P)-dependent dehydrogenase (short-subunit alcohol dehydrogenase family) [Bacillus sp. SORGH_AS_0510]